MEPCRRALGVTTITDANFETAISTCLGTNSTDGLCSSSEYGPMPDWDVSGVTNMYQAFYNKNDFNADISDWDVSNVMNMEGMFYGASSFNQMIGGWDTSSVTTMTSMFFEASNFNQPIGWWDVSSVLTMNVMFY